MANSGTGGGGQGRGYGEELPGKYGGEDDGGEHVLGAVARDGVKLGGRERAVGGGEEGADAWVERIGGEKGRVEGEEGGDGGEGGVGGGEHWRARRGPEGWAGEMRGEECGSANSKGSVSAKEARKQGMARRRRFGREIPPREAGRRIWASVTESAGGDEMAESGTRRMRARAVRREVRRERAKGRCGCGAEEEAVRWGGSERMWMEKSEEGRAESVRTRRRICMHGDGGDGEKPIDDGGV